MIQRTFLLASALISLSSTAAEYYIVARTGDPIPSSAFTMQELSRGVWYNNGIAFRTHRANDFTYTDYRLFWADTEAIAEIVSPNVAVPIAGLVDNQQNPVKFRTATQNIDTDGNHLYFIATYQDWNNSLKLTHGLFRIQSPLEPAEVIAPSTEALFDFTFTAPNPPAMLRVRNGKILIGQNTGNQGFESYLYYDGEEWVTVADSTVQLPGGAVMRMENATFADLSADGERVAFVVSDNPTNPSTRKTYLYEWHNGELTLLASSDDISFGLNLPAARYGTDGIYLNISGMGNFVLHYQPGSGITQLPLPSSPPPGGRDGNWYQITYVASDETHDYFSAYFVGGTAGNNPGGIFRRESDGSMTEVFNDSTSIEPGLFVSEFRAQSGIFTLSTSQLIATTGLIDSTVNNPWESVTSINGWKDTAIGPVYDSQFPHVYLARYEAWAVITHDDGELYSLYFPSTGAWYIASESWQGWFYSPATGTWLWDL